MENSYIITTSELQEKGIDLNQYVIDGNMIPAFINLGLDMAITRILELNDDFIYEEDIENALINKPKLVKPFKKLQHRVIYNLLFLGDNDPLDKSVDSIICWDLKWGKINGFQKSIYGNNRG